MYDVPAGRPNADAVVVTACGAPPVLNRPTTAVVAFSFFVNTCVVAVFTSRVASIASWSTDSTDSLVSMPRSVLSRLVRSVPRISGDAASAHRLNCVFRSSSVSPPLSPLPTSSES